MADFAQLYTNTSAQQAKEGNQLIDQINPEKNSRVLDLGCGTGYLASILAKRVGPGGYVVGVDPDNERLALAQQEYAATSNLTFVEGSSDDLPEGPYDLVFSNQVLHWIKDKESAFKNVYKSLAEGGCFAFNATENYTSLEHKVFALVDRDPEAFTYWTSCDEYVRIAEDCGFRVEAKAVIPRKICFPNVEAYLDFNSASIGNQGNYDHRNVDPQALAQFKEQFGDKAVQTEPPRITLVLRKV